MLAFRRHFNEILQWNRECNGAHVEAQSQAAQLLAFLFQQQQVPHHSVSPEASVLQYPAGTGLVLHVHLRRHFRGALRGEVGCVGGFRCCRHCKNCTSGKGRRPHSAMKAQLPESRG